MIPIWRGGSLSLIAPLGFRVCFFSLLLFLLPKTDRIYYLSGPSQTPPQLIHSPDSFLTSMHVTPVQALQMNVELRARHSLAMHFATFAGSDYEVLEPIVDLEQAKRAMGTVTGAMDGQGSKDEGVGVSVVSVGDWWTEGGMGTIDAGETTVVHVGKTPLCLEPLKDHRTVG